MGSPIAFPRRACQSQGASVGEAGGVFFSMVNGGVSVFSKGRSSPWDPAPGLALALAGVIFCGLANVFPIVTFNVEGLKQSNLLITGVVGLHHQGFDLVAALVFLGSILAPSLRLLALAWALGACQMNKKLPGMLGAARLARKLKPWSLVEVYAVAIVVALARLDLLGSVSFEIGSIFVVGLLGISLALEQFLDESSLEARLAVLVGVRGALAVPEEARPIHPDSVQKTWALIVAGFLFYGPANLLPVMNIMVTGDLEELTIWGGVVELYDVGLGPVALLVLFASMVVPLLKLLGLTWILLTLDRSAGREHREKLFQIIHLFGRWSMVDVFLLSILVAVGQLGMLASVDARSGAIFFCMVFLCTVFAVEQFDPRLIRTTPARRVVAKPVLTRAQETL